MKTFRIKSYEIRSSKIKEEKGLRFVLLADLHGLEFGRDNGALIGKIRKCRPDGILCAGDMLVRCMPETLRTAEKLLLSLAGEFPVFLSLGNHECRMRENEELGSAYKEYEKRLVDGGVRVLHNRHETVNIKGTEVALYGLELPMKYYHKPNSPRLSKAELEQHLGFPPKDAFSVLLAHNPKYGKAYFSWGADLTVSGHYHGGILRLGEHHGLSCPQFLFLPPFCCGDFHKKEQHMIVSAGLGEHTVPVRIHNPRELLVIICKPLENRAEKR